MTKFVPYHSRKYRHLINTWTSHWVPPKTFEPTLLRPYSTHFITMKHHEPILKGKYPAKSHCAKVAAYLKERVKDDSPARIYLQGQKTRMIEDNDEPQPFRSEHLVARAQVPTDLYDIDSVVTSFISLAAIYLTAISSTISLPPLSPSSFPHSIHPPSFGLACPFPRIKLYTSTMLTTFALRPNSTITLHPLENPDHPHPLHSRQDLTSPRTHSSSHTSYPSILMPYTMPLTNVESQKTNMKLQCYEKPTRSPLRLTSRCSKTSNTNATNKSWKPSLQSDG